MPFCCFEAFWGKFIENLFFWSKKWPTKKKRTEIHRKFLFLTVFEIGQILRKIWICLNNFFWSNQLKRININKNSFSPKSEPHTDKLGLCVVLKHFWEIHREIFFLDTKWLSQKRALKYSESLFFLPCLKGENLEENFDLFKQLFLNKQAIEDK